MSLDEVRLAEFAIRVFASLSLVLLGCMSVAKAGTQAAKFAKSLPVVGGRDGKAPSGPSYLLLVCLCFPGALTAALGLRVLYRLL